MKTKLMLLPVLFYGMMAHATSSLGGFTTDGGQNLPPRARSIQNITNIVNSSEVRDRLSIVETITSVTAIAEEVPRRTQAESELVDHFCLTTSQGNSMAVASVWSVRGFFQGIEVTDSDCIDE